MAKAAQARTAAAEPKQPPPLGSRNAPEDQRLVQHLESMLGGLRTDRYSWWTHWREIADYIIPRRYKWLITPNQANRGSPINQKIIDSTGSKASQVLAAGMMSGMTSPSRRWFKPSLDNEDLAEDGEVKVWLGEVQTRMEFVLAESNYYNCKAVQLGDLGNFGTAPLVIYEDFEDVIRCYNSTTGEYFLANSDRMSVDIFYREFVLTTRQVADKFGLDNCSDNIKAAIQTAGAALTREVIIGHAIEPNNDHLPTVPGLKKFPWREVYWERGFGGGQSRGSILSIRGFHEKPFSAPRWDITANDAYGRSPAMDALGDIKQLQVETKRKAQAIDKMVNPPLVADAQLKNEPATQVPGGVTYVANLQANTGMRPLYEVRPQIGEMMEDIKEVQERIKVCFFNDLFLMISQLDTVRTATEIDARREEKLIQLGPVLERFENEALDPELDRVFNIMLRAGLFPPIPQALRGQNIRMKYVSMLAEAQRAASTSAIERLAAFMNNLIQAHPEAADNINVDEMIDEYADMLGVSPKVIVPLQKVMQIRAQRAQQQQQQVQAQNAMAATQAAKNLSSTDMGGGQNALQAMAA